MTQSQDLENEEFCYICFEGANRTKDGDLEPLVQVCRCPTRVHRRCVARWQLYSAGKREEKSCRFCQGTLPDWKEVLTPRALPPAIPVLSIYYNNTCCRMKVRPGPDGLQAFLRQLEVIVGRDVANVNFVFRCRCPDTGAEIFLQGLQAFEAAMHCACVRAAQRSLQQQQQQQQLSLLGEQQRRQMTQGPQRQQQQQEQPLMAHHQPLPIAADQNAPNQRPATPTYPSSVNRIQETQGFQFTAEQYVLYDPPTAIRTAQFDRHNNQVVRQQQQPSLAATGGVQYGAPLLLSPSGGLRQDSTSQPQLAAQQQAPLVLQSSMIVQQQQPSIRRLSAPAEQIYDVADTLDGGAGSILTEPFPMAAHHRMNVAAPEGTTAMQILPLLQQEQQQLPLTPQPPRRSYDVLSGHRTRDAAAGPQGVVHSPLATPSLTPGATSGRTARSVPSIVPNWGTFYSGPTVMPAVAQDSVPGMVSVTTLSAPAVPASPAAAVRILPMGTVPPLRAHGGPAATTSHDTLPGVSHMADATAAAALAMSATTAPGCTALRSSMDSATARLAVAATTHSPFPARLPPLGRNCATATSVDGGSASTAAAACPSTSVMVAVRPYSPPGGGCGPADDQPTTADVVTMQPAAEIVAAAVQVGRRKGSSRTAGSGGGSDGNKDAVDKFLSALASIKVLRPLLPKRLSRGGSAAHNGSSSS